MSLDAMKQALDALEWNLPVIEDYGDHEQLGRQHRAITALRAAIEQAQKPVAWQVMVEDEATKEFPIKDMAHDWCAKKKLSGSPSAYWIRPLYTAPRQWQRLTDEEIENMMDYWSEPARSAYGGAHTANGEYVCIADIIRDAEKRLKEKNNG